MDWTGLDVSYHMTDIQNRQLCSIEEMSIVSQTGSRAGGQTDRQDDRQTDRQAGNQ